MQPKKISDKASKIIKVEKALLGDINKFKLELEKRTIVAMRRYVAENVDKVFQKVMREADKENEDITTFPIVYPGKVVWVCAFHFKKIKKYDVSAIKIFRRASWYVAFEQRKKGEIYLPVEAFKKIIRELITLIQDGKHDENIRLTAEQLIYDKMLKKLDYIISKTSAPYDLPKYEAVTKDKKVPE